MPLPWQEGLGGWHWIRRAGNFLTAWDHFQVEGNREPGKGERSPNLPPVHVPSAAQLLPWPLPPGATVLPQSRRGTPLSTFALERLPPDSPSAHICLQTLTMPHSPPRSPTGFTNHRSDSTEVPGLLKNAPRILHPCLDSSIF